MVHNEKKKQPCHFQVISFQEERRVHFKFEYQFHANFGQRSGKSHIDDPLELLTEQSLTESPPQS
jgi:hypothetical protein